MKKILLIPSLVTILGLIPMSMTEAHNLITPVVDYIEPPSISTIIPTPQELVLIKAMIHVESRGNDSIVGDNGKAVGCLQIWPIMVKQVNQDAKVLGLNKKFTNKDRFSRKKSIEIFIIWKRRHHVNSSYEKIARNWNGGPQGFKKESTEHYWNKITNFIKNGKNKTEVR